MNLPFSRAGLDALALSEWASSLGSFWEVWARSGLLPPHILAPSAQVLTFDARGISGHPNHVDVHNGVR